MLTALSKTAIGGAIRGRFRSTAPLICASRPSSIGRASGQPSVPRSESLCSAATTRAQKSVQIIVGVRSDGTKDVLGLLMQATEGAKFWLTVLSELRQRGVEHILVLCAHGCRAHQAHDPLAWTSFGWTVVRSRPKRSQLETLWRDGRPQGVVQAKPRADPGAGSATAQVSYAVHSQAHVAAHANPGAKKRR
jgi:hypothetical protein